MKGQKGSEPGDAEDLEEILIMVGVGELNDVEGRAGLGLPLGFHRRELCWLGSRDIDPLGIADDGDTDQGDQTKDRGQAEAPPEEFDLVLAEKMPGRNPEDKKGTDHIGGQHCMAKAEETRRVGEDREEVRHLIALVGSLVADRMLHPAIGEEDPERGEVGDDRGESDGQGVGPLRELVPAEDPGAEKHRYKEEGDRRLDGQRRPENVSDLPRVLRPVHAELELERDAGDDSQGEVDEEELAPELCRLEPEQANTIIWPN